MQMLLPLVGLLFELIGQDQQLAVNQWIATGWSARHSPKAFRLLAKLFDTFICECPPAHQGSPARVIPAQSLAKFVPERERFMTVSASEPGCMGLQMVDFYLAS